MDRVIVVVALCVGCNGDSVPVAAADFPADFLFGAAMAGFQVDPGCPTLPASECEDAGSDWYQWVTDPDLIADSGTHVTGEPLSNGPGHWELYPEDFARASDEMHLGALRVSLEWSRLFPNEPVGAQSVDDLMGFADPGAVAAYHDYFDEMRAHGLEPMVTLNHYTLPLWLHDGKACHEDIDGCTNRGWLDEERMVEQIALYSGFCAREFGPDVRLWATLNEPFAVVLSGYMLPGEDRTNPPGVTQPVLGVDVLWAMIAAHAAMYDAVHAEDDDAEVGLVPNLVVALPNDPESDLDKQGAEHLDYVYNRVFLNAAIDGDVDRNLDGVAESQSSEWAGRMDFIGVNYYTSIAARGLTVPLIADYPWTDFLPVGSFWNEYPEGLGAVVKVAGEYGLPVYITENGTSNQEDAADRFLVPHLQSLVDAMDDGADVRGYFLWSLLDNYEWNHGMAMRFGAYEVDLESKSRTLRPLGQAYADIAQSRRLP